MNRHVHRPQPFLLVAIHVTGIGIARLLAGIHKSAIKRIAAGTRTHMQRARIAPVGVTALSPGLGLAEIGQAMGVGPVFQARTIRPSIVVKGVPTDVDHAIDG